MSPYRIALIVFFAAVGLLFCFNLEATERAVEVVAGVAAFVAGALLLFSGSKDRSTT